MDAIKITDYLSNFSAGFCSSNCVIFPPYKLYDGIDDPIIEDCHIYLITRIPKARISENALIYENGKFFIEYKQIDEMRHLVVPKENTILSAKATSRDGRQFEITHFDGKRTYGDFPIFIMQTINNSPVSKHEIVYIGQAYGSDGERNIIDRLKRHETLQKILAINAVDSPDTDVYILGFKYTENDFVHLTFNGTDKSLISDDRDRDRISHVLQNEISEKDSTTIVEAGLIRYFRPIYNEKFKEIFPNRNYKFLEGIDKEIYHSFSVEINIEDLNLYIGTNNTGFGMHHIAKYKINPGKIPFPYSSFGELLDYTGLTEDSWPILLIVKLSKQFCP